MRTSSKKKALDPLTVKNACSNSDSGMGSGQSSISSSAGSSPLSPAVLPGSPDPRTGKRNEPCTGRTSTSETQPSPAKKMKVNEDLINIFLNVSKIILGRFLQQKSW